MQGWIFTDLPKDVGFQNGTVTFRRGRLIPAPGLHAKTAVTEPVRHQVRQQ
jgi:hypothetical protein